VNPAKCMYFRNRLETKSAISTKGLWRERYTSSFVADCDLKALTQTVVAPKINMM
jgi:hypothetical protein